LYPKEAGDNALGSTAFLLYLYHPAERAPLFSSSCDGRLFIFDARSFVLRYVNRYSLRSVVLLLLYSLVLAFVTYGVSFLLVRSYILSDVLALEGILFILMGAGFLLGSGGISRNTSKAAMLASAAKTMGEETIGPSEVMRRDAWKPKGRVRLGLTAIVAGVILVILSIVFV
jgi:hypothetical protein